MVVVDGKRGDCVVVRWVQCHRRVLGERGSEKVGKKIEQEKGSYF